MNPNYSLRQLLCLLSSLVVFAVNGHSAEKAVENQNETLAADTDNTGKEWIVEKTGEYLPLDTMFVDEHGTEIRLGSLLDKPTLILPIYFYCPSSCSKNLANMAVAMNRMSFTPGRDYHPLALSFSETENSTNALRAKQNYLKLVYDDFPAEEWKFLTGSGEAIRAVTEAMGYRFKKLADGTYIHPSAVIAVGADGKIIRYVYGSFVPGDMDMAVANARDGTPALSVKRFLEFCLNYDPDKNSSLFLYVKIAVLTFFCRRCGDHFVFRQEKEGSLTFLCRFEESAQSRGYGNLMESSILYL